MGIVRSMILVSGDLILEMPHLDAALAPTGVNRADRTYHILISHPLYLERLEPPAASTLDDK